MAAVGSEAADITAFFSVSITPLLAALRLWRRPRSIHLGEPRVRGYSLRSRFLLSLMLASLVLSASEHEKKRLAALLWCRSLLFLRLFAFWRRAAASVPEFWIFGRFVRQPTVYLDPPPCSSQSTPVFALTVTSETL